MAEVFISYSQKDRALVAPFAARLAELGVEAWFDREISAGESFGAVIRARLKEAKAILVCWSPEAIESKWVDAEAEYAREVGSYLPVYIAPCALLPPFNTIHADDLSKWKGEANDPAWIRLIGRIAKLINREGVAAAAHAFATGDEQARYDFARRYPDEPTARKIWTGAEARHRELFAKRMAEAKSATDARIHAERAVLEARLEAATPAFELWLADEQRATAHGPPPDPLDLIEQAKPSEDPRLREEISTLQSALAQAKAKENQLDAAKAEVARLSSDLATLKIRNLLEPTEHVEKQHSRDERVELESALDKAKANEAELDVAKAKAAGLSAQLAAARAASSQPWIPVAFIGLVAAGLGALVAFANLRPESNLLKAQVEKLSSDLASARNSLAAANMKQIETQARPDSLAKQLQDSRSYASDLESQLATAKEKIAAQAQPAAQPPPPPPVSATNQEAWFVIVATTFESRNRAEASLAEFGQHCQNYKSYARVVSLGETVNLPKEYWTVGLGPYLKRDAQQLADGIFNCGSYGADLVQAKGH